MDIRKNALDLTSFERDDFLQALISLKNRPARPGVDFSVYDQFVALHAAVMSEVRVPGGNGVNVGHNDIGFLAWHREYLRRFELALQAEVPGVTLPYWDWADHSGNMRDLFTDSFMGQALEFQVVMVGGAARPQPVPMTMGYFAHDRPASPPQWWPPNAAGWRIHERLNEWRRLYTPGDPRRATLHRGRPFSGIPSVWPPSQPQLDYLASLHIDLGGTQHHLWAFWRELEGGRDVPATHNAAHNWIGGHMARAASPNDPVFWLHHANVDRLWALWQEHHTRGAFSPDRVDDYPQTTDENPWNKRQAPEGHKIDDMMWPWVGTTPGYVVPPFRVETSVVPPGSPPLPSDFVDIRDMLIDYPGEPPRFVRDVLDPAQVHGGYQYQPPQP